MLLGVFPQVRELEQNESATSTARSFKTSTELTELGFTNKAFSEYFDDFSPTSSPFT